MSFLVPFPAQISVLNMEYWKLGMGPGQGYTSTCSTRPSKIQFQTLSVPQYFRKKKLEESCQYQQFCVGVAEEEAWLNEKTALLSSEEGGDTLATVQVKKSNQDTWSNFCRNISLRKLAKNLLSVNVLSYLDSCISWPKLMCKYSFFPYRAY